MSSAVIEGFRQARGNILACMGAHLSHPPEALPKLLKAVEKDGADFAIGSRYVTGAGTDESWGLFRWLNSKVATLLARPFTSVKDPMAGFFALHKDIFAQADNLNPIGYKIALELIVKCNCHYVIEVPIHFANRKFGESKLGFREQVNYIKHLKRLADFKFGWFSHLIQFLLDRDDRNDCGSSFLFNPPYIGRPMVLVYYPKFFSAGSFPVLCQTGIAIGLGRALAIWMAMTWNFYFNRRLTFSRNRHDGIMLQYWQFIAVCSLGALINLAISVGLSHWIAFFNNYKLIAATVSIGVCTIFNFMLSKC